jgi:outer membrane receptor protein involved in Fe transport
VTSALTPALPLALALVLAQTLPLTLTASSPAPAARVQTAAASDEALSGRVIGRSGPVAGAKITAQPLASDASAPGPGPGPASAPPAGTTTDAEGRFRLPVKGPGPWLILVTADGFTPETIEAAAGAPPIDIALRLPSFAESVTVAGDRLNRTLFDSQASVQAFDAKTIEQAPARDLVDLLVRTPNVAVIGLNSSFSIRGIRENGMATGAPVASTYVDGAVMSRFGGLRGPMSSWDLAQAEVLRGPQSTAQGRNALAGAIIIRSKDPTPAWDGAARLALGGNDTSIASFAGGGPLVRDQLAFRVTLDRQYTGGSVYNVTRNEDDWNRREQFAGRAKLLLTPAAAPQLRLLYTFTRARDEFGRSWVVGGLSSRQTAAADTASWTRTDFTGHVVDATWRFGPSLTLDAVTASGRTTAPYEQDADYTAEPTGLYYRLKNPEKTFTEEVRLRYVGSRLRAVGGLYFANIRLEDDETGLVGPIPAVSKPAGIPFFDIDARLGTSDLRRNVAFFGEAEFRVSPAWALIGGLRADREQATYGVNNRIIRTTDLGTFLNGLIDSYLPADVRQTSEYSYSALLPKAGIVRHFGAGRSVGFTVQRGYRAGGTSANIQRGFVQTYDPEYTWNYEGSARFMSPTGRVSLTGNLFYTDWRDQQVLVGTGYDTSITNAGKSHLYGAETEARVHPRQDWPLDITVGLGYVRTRFDSFVNGAEDWAGHEFMQAPRWSGTTAVTWAPARGVTAEMDLSYRTSAFHAASNTDKRSPYALANARAGWQAGRWGLMLDANNLFDRRYPVIEWTAAGGTLRIGDWGERRVVRLMLTTRF